MFHVPPPEAAPRCLWGRVPLRLLFTFTGEVPMSLDRLTQAAGDDLAAAVWALNGKEVGR
jgi:hypothetical protein